MEPRGKEASASAAAQLSRGQQGAVPLHPRPASRSCFPGAPSQGMEKPPGCLPFATYLVVPANDKIQAVHKLLESVMLSEEVLGAVRDVLLLLEVQVLHLPQNSDEL